MIARSIATALLLNFVCQMSPAIARGGAGTADPPWNSEHIDQLPAEVRSAISHLCGPSLRAAHYFATYSENSRFLNLHFERSQLQNFPPQAGYLHQVYILRNRRYRLFRSYYGSGND
jgi:hypothetical protein